jgi:nitrogen-specific signal transduction histidine kinase
MSASLILAAIPWTEILKYSPIIVETAGKIYDSVRRYISPEEGRGKKAVSLGDVARRVRQLEENELAQAELIQNIAKQLNEIALAAKVTANRSWIALFFAVTAFVLSVLAIT